MKKITLFLMISYVHVGCAIFGAKDQSDDSGKTSQTQQEVSDGFRSSKSVRKSSVVKFGSTLVKSMTNNPLTSRVIKTQRAGELTKNLNAKSILELEDAVAATRLSGSRVSEVLNTTRVLMDRIFAKRGITAELPEKIKLELGLAAVQERNLGLATYFLNPLIVYSKNKKIKAGAYNAMGVLYLKMNEIPDAIQAFRKALTTSPRYPAAAFNLGMLALKYGDFGVSKSYLSNVSQDWYAQIGLIVANRHLMRNSDVENLCKSVMRSKGSHKMVLYNCGLFFAQNRGDKNRGREYITRATQKPGGENDWDQKAFSVLENLD